MKILLAITGSVAAKLTPQIAGAIVARKYDLKLVVTEPSLRFWDIDSLGMIKIYRDKDELSFQWYRPGSSILHIELREWADLFLVAPLSFNTLGKFAGGLADNLVTSVMAAWDRNKPIILAPAMNTEMWENPVVLENLARLKNRYKKLTIVDPIVKKLACGTEGVGALASIETIMESIFSKRFSGVEGGQ